MEMISTDGNWHTETIASYKVKPSDQLKFIIKDCQEALVAMPDSPKAGQYMDCIHYAAMELNERQRAWLLWNKRVSDNLLKKEQ